MNTNIKFDEVSNSLDFVKSMLMSSLQQVKPEPLKLNTVEEVQAIVMHELMHAMSLGNFSYDPGTGEVIISMASAIDFMSEVDNEMSVGEVIQEFFRSHDWKTVIVIPGRVGVQNTLIRLGHDMLKVSELQQQDTRVSRAVASALAR